MSGDRSNHPLINLLSIHAAAQAAYISEVLAQTEGYDHHSAGERNTMLLGYILGLSVALNAETSFSKAELAARIDELDGLMGGEA